MVTSTAIKKKIGNNQMMVFLIPKIKYAEVLNSLTSVSVNMYDSTCYVSLNKPYDVITGIFERNKINTKSMYFIDAVTVGFDKPKVKNVYFVTSPKALTEIDIEMNKVIKKNKIKSVVFDSLSTLLVYDQPSDVIKFSHSVISKLRSGNVIGFFIMLKEDIESELMKDLSMFVDKVVELK